MDLEVTHNELSSYTLYINGEKKAEGRCQGQVKLLLENGNIEFWLNPREQHWGIVPLIRINGFLVNHYIAGITVYDHMIQFAIDENFYQSCSQKQLESIQALIPKDKLNDNLYLDTHFGIMNSNPDLVAEIKSLLHEKFSTNNSSANQP